MTRKPNRHAALPATAVSHAAIPSILESGLNLLFFRAVGVFRSFKLQAGGA